MAAGFGCSRSAAQTAPLLPVSSHGNGVAFGEAAIRRIRPAAGFIDIKISGVLPTLSATRYSASRDE
jgi:hypothetical protein